MKLEELNFTKEELIETLEDIDLLIFTNHEELAEMIIDQFNETGEPNIYNLLRIDGRLYSTQCYEVERIIYNKLDI